MIPGDDTATPYPSWKFYPARERPPKWVAGVVTAFEQAQSEIDSRAKSGLTSDLALAGLRPYLVTLGFEVKGGKRRSEKIRRPVLFGEQGAETMSYEVAGFHPAGIALEVEAGRGARGNAVYRDLIEASLLVDAQYLVLAVVLEYRTRPLAGQRPYAATRTPDLYWMQSTRATGSSCHSTASS